MFHRLTATWLAPLLVAGISLAVSGLQSVVVGQGVEASACDKACDLLRNRIAVAGIPPVLIVGDEVIHASEVLPAFYEGRAYRMAWSGNLGPLSHAHELVEAIRGADANGLRPDDYHLKRIEALARRLPNELTTGGAVAPHMLVDLDLLLTDAYLVYASHLLNGHINPETIDPEWHIKRSEADLSEILATALRRNKVADSLGDLLPRYHCAAGLRSALAAYSRIASGGGWPEVPAGPTLKKGDTGDRVGALRRRLEITGELPPQSGSDVDSFDDALEAAVRLFQERQGLEVDGMAGPRTIAAANVSAEERIRQIEVNMERWRWLPQDLGERHILVNIASFELRAFEAGESVLGMRVVVGRDYRQTPIFSDLMTYLVINPYWNIPPDLAVEDKIPLIIEDPGYLGRNGIRIVQGWGEDSREIDPVFVDWANVIPEEFPYRLRQDPGPDNPLGRIKFMFPNEFNVYLHDTPARDLFASNTRAFSSGCIRVEDPVGLAEYLLRGDPEWTRAAIVSAVHAAEQISIRIPEPIRVHLLYCTAWLGTDGEPQFRLDIYDRDRLVAEALSSPPPPL
jgi:murein L,D-transpeptidase YcbB/YkuD